MFIRERAVNGTKYFAVVENLRVMGKVRQRTVVSLGQCSAIDEAIEECQWWIEEYRKLAGPDERGRTRNGRRLFFIEGGGCCVRVCGREAQKRADKLEGKLKLLLHCRDVVSKTVPAQATF